MSLSNKSIVPPLRLTFLMWAVFVLQFSYNWNLDFLGVYPRKFTGLLGIFTMPFVHGDVAHIASNTFPLIFLGSALYLFYDKIANRVFMQCFFAPSLLVWIIGRPSYHIGASGLIYGLAFFLISFGIFRKDLKSLLISATVILLYGGLIYGVVPINRYVSWEAHLMGAIVGVASSFGFSNFRKVST